MAQNPPRTGTGGPQRVAPAAARGEEVIVPVAGPPPRARHGGHRVRHDEGAHGRHRRRASRARVISTVPLATVQDDTAEWSGVLRRGTQLRQLDPRCAESLGFGPHQVSGGLPSLRRPADL
jgi:hypothetical protein